jgi:hypothetical protein
VHPDVPRLPGRSPFGLAVSTKRPLRTRRHKCGHEFEHAPVWKLRAKRGNPMATDDLAPGRPVAGLDPARGTRKARFPNPAFFEGREKAFLSGEDFTRNQEGSSTEPPVSHHVPVSIRTCLHVPVTGRHPSAAPVPIYVGGPDQPPASSTSLFPPLGFRAPVPHRRRGDPRGTSPGTGRPPAPDPRCLEKTGARASDSDHPSCPRARRSPAGTTNSTAGLQRVEQRCPGGFEERTSRLIAPEGEGETERREETPGTGRRPAPEPRSGGQRTEGSRFALLPVYQDPLVEAGQRAGNSS